MASKRKIGVARRAASAVSPAPIPDGRRIGVAQAKPSNNCPDCTGSIRGGTWIHTARCSQTVILWFVHGFRAEDWTGFFYRCCPYQCAGTILASGVTHSHECQFWTPLDREIVAEARREMGAPVDAQTELDSLWNL